MKVKAYAKLNLFLEILGKREDGYHLLRSLMQQVDLYDLITIEFATEDSFRASVSEIEGEDNLIIKALKAFRRVRELGPLSIYLEKNIPMGAGLGGGSSDAASALLAFNSMVDDPLSMDELRSLGLSLGADVPFFMGEKAAVVEGIGEIIRAVEPRDLGAILLIKPPCHLSTVQVYRELNANDYKGSSRWEGFMRSYDEGKVPRDLVNHLAAPAVRLCPEISRVLETLKEKGFSAMVTGSGSCIFCFLEERDPPEGLESYWNFVTRLR